MNMNPKLQKNKDWYVTNFKSFEEKLNGQSRTFLHDLRKEALLKLADLSFPTIKDEEWKYTNVSPILKHNFLPAFGLCQSKLNKDDIKKYLFHGFDFHLVTFINGIFSKELSDPRGLLKGSIVDSLSNVVKNNPDFIKEHFNKFSKIDNVFNALNLVYAVDGFVIIVSDGVVVDKPIQVLYLNGDNKNNVLSAPRNLIIAGKNSQVNVITSYYGLGTKQYLTNAVTEVFVDQYGIVDLLKNQSESEDSYHIEKVQAYQLKNSVFNHYNFEFGGSIVRNDINSVLDGENIETHYYGLTLANNDQHIDNHTFIDHAKQNCMSNEVYKAILDGNAHGVFNGKIIVRQDAQKTNAYQQNKTILLSKQAKIDTKPQLEIFADDVKCSHGATVGHLDDNAYFYIRTRGIPDELAKSMLIRAFANDVVDSVKIDRLKEQINHMIFEHLHRVEIINQ